MCVEYVGVHVSMWHIYHKLYCTLFDMVKIELNTDTLHVYNWTAHMKMPLDNVQKRTTAHIGSRSLHTSWGELRVNFVVGYSVLFCQCIEHTLYACGSNCVRITKATGTPENPNRTTGKTQHSMDWTEWAKETAWMKQNTSVYKYVVKTRNSFGTR